MSWLFPYVEPTRLASGLNRQVLQVIDDELHRYCKRCDQWLALDTEFWGTDPKGTYGTRSECRVCAYERDLARREARKQEVETC